MINKGFKKGFCYTAKAFFKLLLLKVISFFNYVLFILAQKLMKVRVLFVVSILMKRLFTTHISLESINYFSFYLQRIKKYNISQIHKEQLQAQLRKNILIKVRESNYYLVQNMQNSFLKQPH